MIIKLVLLAIADILLVSLIGLDIYFWKECFDSYSAGNQDDALRYLGGAVLILIPLFTGQFFVRILFGNKEKPGEQLKMERSEDFQKIVRSDGSFIHLEHYGNKNNPAILFIHGWNSNSMQWYYQKKFFEKDYHLILIDLPGMGETQATANNNFSLEQFASDLREVIRHTQPLNPIVWGHSIGGMCILTFLKQYPEESLKIKGIILQHTTYTNPLKTIIFSRLLTKSQNLLVESFCSLMIFFSPAVWLFRWMSHFSGNLMLYNRVFLFAGTQTRQQLYFASRRWASARPAYTARGLRGMLRYDATNILQHIKVPALVIGSKLDKLTKYTASLVMSERIPDSSLLTLDRAGHLGLMEQHEKVNEGALKFLTEIHAPVLDTI